MSYITGLCRAYTDYIIPLADDADLERIGVAKGGGKLVDSEEIARYLKEYSGKYYAGGPVANSLSIVASLGGKSAFIGKVADDDAGQVFRGAFLSMGVTFLSQAYNSSDKGSGTCIIFVSPDGQRSIVFNRGCNNDITSNDILSYSTILQDTSILFAGFSIRDSSPDSIFDQARRYAKSAKVATTLQSIDQISMGDIKDVLDTIFHRADIIMGNESEYRAVLSAYHINSFEQLLKVYPRKIFVETLGPDGARIGENGRTVFIPVHPSEVIDTTGAGDAFAGGFLYGLSCGNSLDGAGKIGAYCASRVISKIGARLDGKISLQQDVFEGCRDFLSPIR